MDHVQRAGARQRQFVDSWIGGGVGEDETLPEVGGRREVEGGRWKKSPGVYTSGFFCFGEPRFQAG